MKLHYTMAVIGMALCFAAIPTSWAAGTSKYGHPADCTCTGVYPNPSHFCSDEYVEGASSSQPGAEYIGEPTYLSGVVKCCEGAAAGSCKFELSTQTQTVNVGGWEGTLEVAAKASLPAGFSVEASGSLKKNGSTTTQVNVEAKVECSNSGGCVAHSGKVGPGFTPVTVSLTYSHRCWGDLTGACNGVQVTCGHHNDLVATATVKYLSSQIKEDVTCNRAMTQAEKDQCGCNQCN